MPVERAPRGRLFLARQSGIQLAELEWHGMRQAICEHIYVLILTAFRWVHAVRDKQKEIKL